MADQIKVLVVDDSALARKILTGLLESDPEIKVIGTAENGETAIEMNNRLSPDVITLDIEMPVLDGLTALKRIIETNPKPVIMLSAYTQHGAEATFKALELGAVDFVPKPNSKESSWADVIGEQLRTKVKSVYRSKFIMAGEVLPSEKKQRVFEKKAESQKIVGIGTSTGGPTALIHIFQNIPKNFPSSILVVQHMPDGFTKAFSERLNALSNLRVKEAEDMDLITPGCGYVAPGDQHIFVEEIKSQRYVRLSKGEKVSGHRPSIDVLFNSLASTAGKNTIAVIMTGMGKDGAEGICKIKAAGGRTIAQDEDTSVVF